MRDDFMKVVLNNSEYIFLIGYQKEERYRASFNNLVEMEKTFNISFEGWYSAGYWNEKYIPYTLFDGEKAIANVSVNIMDFNTFGEQKRYIQIGTVLTDEDYRNRNLCKFLMEHVLNEWNDICDFIYLFANNSVLEMYPKFGFRPVKEYAYLKSIEKNIGHQNFEKLNMDIQSNRDLLYKYAKTSMKYGNFAMNENADLIMFYCTSFMKENVYHIKSLDVIAIAVFNNNQLHLLDVVGTTDVELDKIIYSLSNSEIDEVLLGFTPKDCNSYEVKEISGDDETLFVQKNKTALFDSNKIMFPLLSHA